MRWAPDGSLLAYHRRAAGYSTGTDFGLVRVMGDALPVGRVDLTGLQTLEDLHRVLNNEVALLDCVPRTVSAQSGWVGPAPGCLVTAHACTPAGEEPFTVTVAVCFGPGPVRACVYEDATVSEIVGVISLGAF